MLLLSRICWWARELATHHVVCLLWGLGCRVLCWRQRPGPRGELLVTLTSRSELELLILSPSPPSLFSRCPPVRTSSSTKLHSRSADNGRLIDFFLSYLSVSMQCGLLLTWLLISDSTCSLERIQRLQQGCKANPRAYRATARFEGQGQAQAFKRTHPNMTSPPVK